MPDSTQHAAELIRVAVLPDGAFGVLVLDGRPFCVTLERTQSVESEGLTRQTTVIPDGHYVCQRTWFVRGAYETFEIMGVQGHSRLLFHVGNVETDSQGCVLLGTRYEAAGPRPMILDSRTAHTRFMSALSDVNAFPITVRTA